MKNRYHRYLDLPFELKKPPICETTPEGLFHQDLSEWFDPQLNKFLLPFNILPNNVEVFYTPGGKSLPIHVDDWMRDDHTKINISWGPEEGITRWWEAPNFNSDEEYDSSYNSVKDLDASKYENFSDRHHKSIILKEEDCNIVYEANTNRPSLVNVGTFHSSYNPTDVGRWTLCFVLGSLSLEWGERLIWEDAIKLFKDHIIE